MLAPGSNSIPIRSDINQTEVLGLILGKNAPFPSGVIPLDIVGNSSVYDGYQIPYYTEALKANTLQTTVNITQVFIDSGLGQLAGVL